MTKRRKPRQDPTVEVGQVSADDLPDTSKWVPRQKAAATAAPTDPSGQTCSFTLVVAHRHRSPFATDYCIVERRRRVG